MKASIWHILCHPQAPFVKHFLQHLNGCIF
jgi:hypothetical protein